MKQRRVITIIVATFMTLSVAWIWLRRTGTGYIESVTGVSIPWSREFTVQRDYDYGQYSFFRLNDSSIKTLLDRYQWESNTEPERFQNQKLTLDGLPGSDPLPPAQELLWRSGKNEHNRWMFMLHPATRRLWVEIKHPDMAGDF